MYKIYADDTLIYDSTLEDYKIGKGSITLELNKSGSFTFSVYPDHFYYEQFAPLKTVIKVCKFDKIVFRGRILNSVTDYWNNKVITCEGELGFLQDSVTRPFTFIGYPEDLLRYWIEDHNAQVDEFKQFKLGMVTVIEESKGYVDYKDDDYKSTHTNVMDYLVSKLGGYLYITHGEDGTDPIPTINYLADFDKISTQSIEFGVNLKNYTKTVKSEDIATAIIPLGAEIEEDSEGDNSNEYKLTIESVNDGLDYVYSPTGVALYGWIYKVVQWDDIKSAIKLKRTAEEYLNSIVGDTNTIELTAIDLRLLNPEIESINIGEYIRAKSTPHRMDVTLLCTGQSMDILSPENDSFTLGYSYMSLSTLNNELLKNIVSNYITNKRFTREFSKTSSLIEQTEESIRLEVASVYAKQTDLDTIERTLLTQISLGTDSILASVESTYVSKKHHETTISALNIEVGKISTEVAKKVNGEDIGTKIEQNYESVRIAWNQNSKYISFEKGQLNIYDREGYFENNLLLSLGSTGNRYYNEGTPIGSIGTGKMLGSEDRGLVFNLDPEGDYMGWAIYDDESNSYRLKVHYAADTDDFMITSDIVTIGSSDNSPEFNCYRNLDMHNYSILNQSDARLKTNIVDTQIDALNVLSKIDLKSFDWIDSGEHIEVGIIAQQLQEIEPRLVHVNERTGLLSIKTDKLIPYIIKAIQELSKNHGNKRKTWSDPFSESEKSKFKQERPKSQIVELRRKNDERSND